MPNSHCVMHVDTFEIWAIEAIVLFLMPHLRPDSAVLTLSSPYSSSLIELRWFLVQY